MTPYFVALRFVVVVGCLVIAGVLTTGTANAEPTGGSAVTVTLFNCSGPAGTPTSFTIQKEPNGGAAAHVVGSTDIFKRTLYIDLTTGQSFTWGLNHDNQPLITCDVVTPSGHQVVITGFFSGS